ncbi:hypothetical protein BDK51DRAFT_41456 [Blyttiomyces helicus]|uniref:Uncharacterized protein n=1 Tax=Blyttiomyces helicus TaxID=388810 RepID=A0A4V1ISQ8_9FUNG|nr:hypothetical protein BDK51DRAFT_41456 [Blyttiomyces helicus]|eukprot:RKO94407.1 hypothetical protein BDK51DRAFT_41456 [Blyttiomyces helicus]
MSIAEKVEILQVLLAKDTTIKSPKDLKRIQWSRSRSTRCWISPESTSIPPWSLPIRRHPLFSAGMHESSHLRAQTCLRLCSPFLFKSSSEDQSRRLVFLGAFQSVDTPSFSAASDTPSRPPAFSRIFQRVPMSAFSPPDRGRSSGRRQGPPDPRKMGPEHGHRSVGHSREQAEPEDWPSHKIGPLNVQMRESGAEVQRAMRKIRFYVCRLAFGDVSQCSDQRVKILLTEF